MTLHPPWLDDPPAALLRADDVPDRAEVVVVGGSLAGLSAAATLAAGGAKVVLLSADPLGGFAARAPGLVLESLGEHPHRLIASVGKDAAKAMHAFLEQNRAALQELGVFEQTGSIAAAAMENEGPELVEHLDDAAAVGLQVQGLTAAQVNQRLGSQGFGPGRFAPQDGLVPPLAPIVTLVRAAREAGAALCPGVAVRSHQRVDGGQQLRLAHPDGERMLMADAVIMAAGWRLASLDGWFEHTVHPVRHQWIATAAPTRARLALPVTAQHGFSQWSPAPDGRTIAGGARFGSMHMESGETDDSVINERIDHILRANLARFFPDLDPNGGSDGGSDGEITHAWTAIATHTCDGLPILGPLPGRVDVLACTGFHGLDHSLAVRAGQVVAQGLLTGKAPAIPKLFGAARMV